MSILTVVKDVCVAVGVEQPASVFAGINANRTMQEMLAVANETAQRIAYDTREWGILKRYLAVGIDSVMVSSPPVQSNFQLPSDFKRMLLTSNVRKLSIPRTPLRFIPDQDEWLTRRALGVSDYRGEWTIIGNDYFSIVPPITASEQVFFVYLGKNCLALGSGGFGDTFQSDNDAFMIDERVLKLGMIWQWKALKGSPYAEDMSNYETALARVSGADVPAPIIVGRMPVSTWGVEGSYPYAL
jgi:hypothetical protein